MLTKSYRALALVAAMLACLAIGWSAKTVLTPRNEIADGVKYAYVKAAEESVGEVLKLDTQVVWPTRLLATNRGRGTITNVEVARAQVVGAGSTLYSIDERPVSIAQGSIPAYRGLTLGDSGKDVLQLQQFLVSQGILTQYRPGLFEASTSGAVRQWQQRLGVPATGSVRIGSLIFVSQLPARISVDRKFIRVGALVSGNEPAIVGTSGRPSFTIEATQAQSQQIKPGMQVRIKSGKKGWLAQIGKATEDPRSGLVRFKLKPQRTGSICATECSTLAAGKAATLASEIVLTERVSGIAVPASALVSRSDGSIVVVDRSGTEHTVTVRATAEGMAIVDGIPAGLKVRLPSDS